MASTDAKKRRIDERLPGLGGGTLIETGGTSAGIGVPTPGAPTGVRLGAVGLLYSAATPQATVTVSWQAPAGYAPDSYVIQWATTSGFVSPTALIAAGAQRQASIAGLPVSTTTTTVTIYVRVAARARGVQGPWSAAVSTPSVQDTTAPAAPSGAAFLWSGRTGDLLLTCTPPTSINYLQVRFRIYDASGGTLLRTLTSPTGRATWTLAMQAQDTAGVYDPAVYVVIDAQSWGGLYSTTIAISPTISAPTAPSGLSHTWAGDTGAAGPDLTALWTLDPNVARYELSLDGTARDVGLVNRHTYTLATNAAEHSGSPDPVISLSLVAINALGQRSTAATATATNAVPTATTIVATGFFASFNLAIAASAAADVKDYRIRAYKDGSGTATDTWWVTSTIVTYEAPSSGSWRFDVSVRDAFGQHSPASALTVAASTTSVAEFEATVRSGLTYTDSVGTAASVLATLKDGITGSGGNTYASSASAYRWTQGDWQLEIVHQTSEVAVSQAITAYLGVSLDGATWSWYAGGTTAGGVWAPVAQASEAAAVSAATSLAAGVWRVDLPAPARARYIRLAHRHTTLSYVLREFFPSTLLRGTYVQAESITAINVAANSLTVDRMVANFLTAYTITGAIIQTAASGQRVVLDSTGLKTYDSAGNLQVEATTATNGALRAGGGAVQLSKDGLRILSTTSYSSSRALEWRNAAETTIYVSHYVLADEYNTYLIQRPSANIAIVAGDATAIGGSQSQGSITLAAYNTGKSASSAITVDGGYSSGAVKIEHVSDLHSFVGPVQLVSGALTVGANASTTTAAVLNGAAGQSRDLAFSSAGSLRWIVRTDGTAESGSDVGSKLLIIARTDAGAAKATLVELRRNDSAVILGASGGLHGFYGGSGATKQTVSGSRGGNAALASLLTALASLGLITNSSSA